MIVVEEAELVEKLREILKTADLTTTTTGIVRRQLEDHFGVHLSDKKAFIREQVDLFLQEQNEVEEKDEEKEEGRSGEDAGSEEEGDEEDEEELEDEDGEGTSNGKESGKKGSTKKGNVERKAGGFTKLCSLSPQLQNFIGESELARTQVVKRIWAYIREHDLQDPKNKRKIVCDEKLFDIFKVKVIDMFQMNKVLSKHIWPLGSHSAPFEKEMEKQPEEEKEGKTRSKEKEKQRKKAKEGEVESSQSKKRQKTGNNPFTAHLKLSEALVKFIGTGESALSRADVVKKMWAYIKENNLQDPSDKRRILCDDNLKELLQVDSFNGFTVAKLLAPHFSKLEQQDDPASNSDESSS